MKKLFTLFILVLAGLSVVAQTPDYLCFTAKNANTKLCLQKVGSPDAVQLQYSTDAVAWTDYTVGDTLTMATAGAKLYWRAGGSGTNVRMGKTANNDYHSFAASDTIAASGNVVSLLDATCTQMSVPGFAFNYLFFRNKFLTSAPKLPMTTLGQYCYFRMFQGCAALTTAPELPATTLANSCYSVMFSGCTSLTMAPALPATSLLYNCYNSMFSGCKSLTTAPALPATTLASDCYNAMFNGCSSLTTAPELPATTLVSSCYNYMFNGCTSLRGVTVHFTDWNTSASATSAWMDGVPGDGFEFRCPNELPVQYGRDFIPEDAIVLNHDYLRFTAVDAGATVQLVANGAPNAVSLQYSIDRTSWSNYTVGTTLTLMNVDDVVYFRATATNATFSKAKDQDYYRFVFASGRVRAGGNIMSLLDVDAATSVVPAYAFCRLFQGAANLVEAPNLLGRTLGESCYYSMFSGCSALAAAPALPAKALSSSCYESMFAQCTALTMAPALSAMSLADRCYYSMFRGCTALVNAPELSATTLTNACYGDMFHGCTAMVKAPALYAKTLSPSCYSNMFNGCTALKSIEVAFSDWGTNDETTDWVSDVNGTGFTFTCPSALPQEFGVSRIPANATPEQPVRRNYLCFEARRPGATIQLAVSGMPDPVSLQYSTDDQATWATYKPGTVLTMDNVGDRIYWRAGGLTGTNATLTKNSMNLYQFVLTDTIAASGNIMSLLDATCEQLAVPDYCFYRLFSLKATTLVSAPELPAATIGRYAYSEMFYKTAITEAPELPATTLSNYCYSYMFGACTRLKSIKVGFTDWAASISATSGWMDKVVGTGFTFTCPADLALEYGTSRIPEGATVKHPTATAIDVPAVPAGEKAIKVLENGRVVIVRDGHRYNLSGQLLK